MRHPSPTPLNAPANRPVPPPAPALLSPQNPPPPPLSRLAAIRLRDRRRRTTQDDVLSLIHRAAWLPPAERELMACVYERGQSVREISRLTGRPTRTLRRQVSQITRRLLTPIYPFVGAQRNAWSAPLRAVATHHFLWGRSIRQTAAALDMPYHAVRSHRDAVLALYSEATPSTRTRSLDHAA